MLDENFGQWFKHDEGRKKSYPLEANGCWLFISPEKNCKGSIWSDKRMMSALNPACHCSLACAVAGRP